MEALFFLVVPTLVIFLIAMLIYKIGEMRSSRGIKDVQRADSIPQKVFEIDPVKLQRKRQLALMLIQTVEGMSFMDKFNDDEYIRYLDETVKMMDNPGTNKK